MEATSPSTPKTANRSAFDLPHDKPAVTSRCSRIDERDFDDQLLDEQCAAAFLSLSAKTLRNWRVKGGGPQYVRISRRAVRYRRKDLKLWADERIVSSTSVAQ